MKRKALSIFILSAILVALVIILINTGNPSKKVPDELLSLHVSSCPNYDSTVKCTWEAQHNVSNKAHMDQVTLTVTMYHTYGTVSSSCSLIYFYDKDSDRWIFDSSGDWTERVYRFNQNLEKTWTLRGTDGGFYEVTILEVKDNRITIDCKVTPDGFIDSLLAKGTFTINDNGSIVDIPIMNKNGEESITTMSMFLDPQTGFKTLAGYYFIQLY